MKVLTLVLFYCWAGALLVLGGGGVFTARWELEHIYRIDLAAMAPAAVGNLLNQYRFLKGIEFGFGLFCFLFRQEIFTVRSFNRLFLAVVFVGAAARVLAIAIDATPHWAFVAVTVLELLTGIMMAAYAWGALAATPSR